MQQVILNGEGEGVIDVEVQDYQDLRSRIKKTAKEDLKYTKPETCASCKKALLGKYVIVLLQRDYIDLCPKCFKTLTKELVNISNKLNEIEPARGDGY